VVALGGSAGALDAVHAILGQIPSDTDMALLVALHGPEEGAGYLRVILQRITAMSVVEVTDDVPLERGVVYLARRNRHLILGHGVVHATLGPKENGFRPAIDPLFRSLAHVAGPAGAAILLSGSNDDGTLGLAAIARAGGCVAVQDPLEATFPEMPASAADAVPAAEVLAVRDVAAFLSACAARQVRPLPMADVDPGPLSRGSEQGPPTSLTCPSCGGSLWKDEQEGAPRYVCRVGHAFSPQRLLELKSEVLEATLWSAVRALEENGDLAARLGRRMRRLGNHRSAERFEARARDVEEQLRLLRGVLDERETEAAYP
jgi:two-component system chemotaxis response regulator CheB